MGKWNRHHELQEYLDDLKERQDHQYSKGYWAGKVRKTYPSPIRAKFTAWYYILFGSLMIIVMAGGVIVSLLRGKDFLEMVSGDTVVLFIFFICLGLLAFWAGVKGVQRSKKGNRRPL